MKRLKVSCCALSVCAAALLAGCAGFQSHSIMPTGAFTGKYSIPSGEASDGLQIMTSHKFSGEIFSGGKSELHCSGGQYAFYSVVFKVNGTAKGPYPGSVTAQGSWFFNREEHDALRFHEKFVLTSRSRRYSGLVTGDGYAPLREANCHHVGRLFYYSTPRGWHGNVLVNITKDQPFSESFY